MSETMRGLWVSRGQISLREDLAIPYPIQGEALIRTRLAGICGTDIQLIKGYYDFEGIPGHEFVGEVVAAANHPALIGKRVVGEINIGCGVCEDCLQGNQKHCANRKVLGIKNHQGVMAEYFTLPITNLHVIGDTIPDEDAVFTEPLAAALQILQQIKLHIHDRVLVIGAGKLGTLIALALHQITDQLFVFARHQDQEDRLKEFKIKTVSATELVNSKWPYIVDASGSPSGLSTAMEHVSPKGTIVVKSTYSEPVSLPLSKIVVDEITITGSRCGNFDAAIDELSKNRIQPHKLISQTYAFDDALIAFDASMKPVTGKILLSFTKR